MYGPDYHCTANNQKDSVHPGHANAFEIIDTCKARGGTCRHSAIASTKEKKRTRRRTVCLLPMLVSPVKMVDIHCCCRPFGRVDSGGRERCC